MNENREAKMPVENQLKNQGLEHLKTTLGKQLYNGESYGLTAYYVEQQGGPKMMGSGFMYAETIGSDYDWAKYGWEVIFNPSPADIKAGDVINWKAGGGLAHEIYGHTGVVRAVADGGNIVHTYEQNADKGRINAEYTRTYDMNPIVSIVRKKYLKESTKK